MVPQRELDGRTVAEVFRESDVRLIVIVHADGELTMAPAGSTVLCSGDRLMLYGGEDSIEKLAAKNAAPRPASSVVE